LEIHFEDKNIDIPKVLSTGTCILLFLTLVLYLFASITPTFAQEKSGKESIKGNLKIVFVIDTSDSMNKGERFIRVRKALGKFVDSLIEGDYLIITTFDTRSYLKYSGIVGEEKVRRAMMRVFDDNYPNQRVEGQASQVILGIERAFNEILETPQYQSTAIVLFTDGDHNPIPTPEDWNRLCGGIIKWRKEPGFEDSRKVFAVDVGDPKHSKKMADDLKVPDDDYFPYSDSTDFGQILEKIRSRLPYRFDIKFFPSVSDMGKLDNPGEITGNPFFILNNPDFIKKGGYVIPKITYFKNGKQLENPGFKTNIPDKIDEEFFTDTFRLKFEKGIAPGKYQVKIAFEPAGPLNAKLSLKNEEGKDIDNVAVNFETTSWLYQNKPLVIFGIIFLLTLLTLYFIMGMYVKKMPVVRGELHCIPEGVDITPAEKKLLQPMKFFIYNHGKAAVSVGRGRDADVRFENIDFLENEHFEIAADTPYRYKVKPLEGRFEIEDRHGNPQYSRNLKNGYRIKVVNPDNPDKQYVLFEIKNRDLG